ncbi:MAG: hypothetical protein PHU75_03860 [Candidatus Nanopelagicales bacterium]|nr:hypothetical protein [Candidatus Nanopelagicales bacterium]
MPAVTMNSQDFLKGALAQIEVAPWVTAAGASAYLNMGACTGIQITGERKMKDVEADNSTWPLDVYNIGSGAEIHFTLKEADLLKFAQAFGDVDTAVAGPTTTTRTYPIDELATVAKWAIKITVAGQSMVPGVNEVAGANTYIKRVYSFHRCVIQGKVAHKLTKSDEVSVDVVAKAYLDTSVTASTTQGRIGKIVDTTT